MRDQATELRNLVLRAHREERAEMRPLPRIVLVAGGQLGVGTTTVAAQLATAWGDQGVRVVLVDADLRRSQLAKCFGCNAQTGLAEVLSAQRSIHEVLQAGLPGVQILPGVSARGRVTLDTSTLAQERLVRQLQSLGRHSDVILIDLGDGEHELAARCWSVAESAVLITAPDNATVMDTYAMIKSIHALPRVPELHLVVNGSADQSLAGDVHRRIDHSCQRFLGLSIRFAGAVPYDEQLRGGPQLGVSPGTVALSQLAGLLGGAPALVRAA